MAERPESDTPGEWHPQALAPAATEQENAETEESQKHQNECRDPAPGGRIINGDKGRHPPAEDDQHQGEERKKTEARAVKPAEFPAQGIMRLRDRQSEMT